MAPGRENRAIAGLSMGGGQAFTIGLKHLDRFAWSRGVQLRTGERYGVSPREHLPGFLDHPDEVNRKLKLLFFSCGTEDPRYPGQLDLADKLKQHGIHYVSYPTPACMSGRCGVAALAEFAQESFPGGTLMRRPILAARAAPRPARPRTSSRPRSTRTIRHLPHLRAQGLGSDSHRATGSAPLRRPNSPRTTAVIWSVTLGPLEPSIYIYSFTVDGVAIPDPVNPRMKLRARTSASLVEVKDDPPAFWEPRDVPHGTVEINWEKSKAINGETRAIWIYTPPEYAQDHPPLSRALPAPRLQRHRRRMDHGGQRELRPRQSARRQEGSCP